jgi:hypothetical protein
MATIGDSVNVSINLAIDEHSRREALFKNNPSLPPATRVIELDWSKASYETRRLLYEIAGCADRIFNIDLRSVRNGQKQFAFFVERYPDSNKDWERILQTYRNSQSVVSDEQRELEKVQWIEQHGSVFLKNLRKDGYKAEQQYVTERAALEYPNFQLVSDTIFDEVDTPSALAYGTATAHHGRVMFAKQPPPNASETRGLFPESCEVVVIEPFLDRYCLAKWIWALMPSDGEIGHVN